MKAIIIKEKKGLPTKEKLLFMFSGPSEKEIIIQARHRPIRQTE